MNWLPFFGFGFFIIILGLRFFTYRSMTHKVCSLDPDNDYCRRHYRKNLDKNIDPYHKCDVVYGETPNGGVKTVICYLDDKNVRTSKKSAVKVVVSEYDAEKRVVYETWSSLND
jgi:hypothetical protein